MEVIFGYSNLVSFAFDEPIQNLTIFKTDINTTFSGKHFHCLFVCLFVCFFSFLFPFF